MKSVRLVFAIVSVLLIIGAVAVLCLTLDDKPAIPPLLWLTIVLQFLPATIIILQIVLYRTGIKTDLEASKIFACLAVSFILGLISIGARFETPNPVAWPGIYKAELQAKAEKAAAEKQAQEKKAAAEEAHRELIAKILNKIGMSDGKPGLSKEEFSSLYDRFGFPIQITHEINKQAVSLVLTGKFEVSECELEDYVNSQN